MQEKTKVTTVNSIKKLYSLPLMDLIFKASKIHRKFHNPNEVQISSLISIKTGGCEEDCAYCPQAARYYTGVKAEKLMPLKEVVEKAKEAKESGASRVCLGAAWRNVKNNDEFLQVLDMVKEINKMKVEVCCTLGMLSEEQAKKLKAAGLFAYNHNIDSSEDFYKKIISTRSFDDRLETIKNVQKMGIHVCSGGIIGMGETQEDRINMLYRLSNMNPHPSSVPINALVPVEGTPLEEQKPIDSFILVRMIAVARILMPKSEIRLSAGRTKINKEAQTLCFLGGANSIFAGNKLLTTPNPEFNSDMNLFNDLNITPTKAFTYAKQPKTTKDYRKPFKEKVVKKWTKPTHIIEKNILATQKGISKRKEIRSNKS